MSSFFALPSRPTHALGLRFLDSCFGCSPLPASAAPEDPSCMAFLIPRVPSIANPSGKILILTRRSECAALSFEPRSHSLPRANSITCRIFQIISIASLSVASTCLPNMSKLSIYFDINSNQKPSSVSCSEHLQKRRMPVENLSPLPFRGENANFFQLLEVYRGRLPSCDSGLNQKLDFAIGLREDELDKFL